MMGHSLGLVMMFLGMVFFWVAGEIHNQMQRAVARFAPPETNRPLKNLSEATNPSRVRREYQRLFPSRARRKFLLIRISAVVGVVCLLLGIYLAR
jgi:succinate dehydrogenase hydrophobic anchor subunit